MNLVTCRTGDLYTKEMEDAIHDMFPDMNHVRYRGELHQLPGVWNKLAMFALPLKGPTLYLDLDTQLRDPDLPDLSTDKFMLMEAYWKRDNPIYGIKGRRDTYLNSSVMYWETDQSYIFEKFLKNKYYYMRKYRGIDRFIYWEDDVHYEHLPEDICSSNKNPYLGWTNFITYNGEDYGQYFQNSGVDTTSR